MNRDSIRSRHQRLSLHGAATLPATLLAALLYAPAPALAWRSALYPESWTPGFEDGAGRFLHDFSYAGYHAGESPLPQTPPAPLIDVTQPPYDADPSGATDSTAAIQAAIDDVGAGGGGTVYLPAGTYRVTRAPERNHALHLRHSNVVLRGDGPEMTRLYNATTDMRAMYAFLISPQEDYHTWYRARSDEQAITSDLLGPTTRIPVADTSAFAVDDWIAVFCDATDAFIADHGMTGTWQTSDTPGPMFYRRVVAVDEAESVLVIDAPTRYPLLRRDSARVTHTIDHLEEVGIEALSLGNLQGTTPGWGDDDYAVEGTGAYQAHASFLVFFNHVVNGWMRDVHSFRAPGSSTDVHMLSNGVRLDSSRFITLEGLDLRNTQYKGAGGNGYLFVHAGNDNLITDCQGTNGRHNFTFSFMFANGNVIHRSRSSDPRLPVDFHQRLSMANLIDNLTLDNDNIEAIFRDCCTHGHSTTQSVFWNTEGLSYPDGQFFEYFRLFIVHSQQYGHGYVIGTRGASPNIWVPGGDGTDPVDLEEGEGLGETLEPASLYEDQLRRRLGLPAPDAGAADSAVVDARVLMDSAAPDLAIGLDAASAVDAAGPADAALPDNAASDLFARDVVGVDSGGADASAVVATDGGAPTAPHPEVGCQCGARAYAPPHLVALLVVLGLFRRYRKTDD